LPWRSTQPDRLDPVNLLVLETTPQTIWDSLAGTGWNRPDDGATHRTWVDGRFRRMSDHIALGSRDERVHVRLFPLVRHTLLAAHHEIADERGHHVVTSWDRARSATAESLARAGFRHLGRSEPITPVDLRGAASDGRVWHLAPG
jgi:hypothetical protein